MSDNRRQRSLIEYRSINEDSLKRVEQLIWLQIEADCWILHDKGTWSAMVLVIAQKDKPINRDCFSRGGLVNILKSEGLGDYGKIAENRIEKALEAFIKRPDVVRVNSGDDYLEEMFDRIKGPKADEQKQEDAPILYKELMDEACAYVNAEMTLQEFYTKHKINVSKRNLLMRHSIAFNNLWKNHELLEQRKKQEYPLAETMNVYLQQHPCYQNEDPIKLINDAGHGECLETLHRILFERKDPKKNIVWLYGAPNSGKTTLINFLEEIFCTQEFNFQEKYVTVQEPCKSDQEVQLVISKEFEVDNAFHPNNYTSLKLMGEGLGAQVSNNKYAEFKHQFKGKQFIIASNKLPDCSYKLHKNHNDMWKPMQARMEMISLMEGFSGETAFPYTASHLAGALCIMTLRDSESQNAQESVAEGEKDIGLDDLLEEQSKKNSEEVKQEETLAQAQRDGNMGLLGDCGGSQCTMQQPAMSLSQPILGKRENLEGDNYDLNSVVVSLATYKRPKF